MGQDQKHSYSGQRVRRSGDTCGSNRGPMPSKQHHSCVELDEFWADGVDLVDKQPSREQEFQHFSFLSISCPLLLCWSKYWELGACSLAREWLLQVSRFRL